MFLPTNITLKFGDSGDFVSELQRRLSVVHCFSADAVNGFFDGTTVNGVSQFQSQSGLRADGIAGPETLRRLNGVISGDTSSTEDHKPAEDEAARQQQAAEQLQRQLWIAEQERQAEEQRQLLAQQQQQAAYAPLEPQPTYAQPVQPPQPVYQQPAPQPQQHYQQPDPQSYTQPVPQQPIYQPQPAAPSAGDLLAQMLLQPQPSAQPSQTYTPAPPPTAQPQHYQQAPVQQPHVATQIQAQDAPPQQYQQPYTQPAPTTPEQSRGIVGRAVQYANEVVQKLANYFESKLPRHVIDEVKELGHVMAKSGVKEATIPTGPEQQRGVEGPARGQQQGKQLG